MSKLQSFFIFIILLFAIEKSANSQDNTKNLPEGINAKIKIYLDLAYKYEAENNIRQSADYYNKAAYLYWENNFSEEAIEYFNKSIEKNIKIGNQNALKILYTNLGMIYSDIEKYTLSLDFFQKSLEIRRKLKVKTEIISGLVNIAQVYGYQSNWQAGIKIMEEALELSKEENNMRLMRSCYNSLSEFYGKIGDVAKSKEYFEIYSSLEKHAQQEAFSTRENESKQILNSYQKKSEIAESEIQKKETELADRKKRNELARKFAEEVATFNTASQGEVVKRDEKVQLQLAQLRVNQFIKYSLLAGIVIALLVGFVLYYAFRQKQKAATKLAIQNWEIQERNKEIRLQRDSISKKSKDLEDALLKLSIQNIKIKDSISYAHRIQAAMFPEEKFFYKLFPQSFILLKPRDIVSGDFYWFRAINGTTAKHVGSDLIDDFQIPERISKVVLAAVDCTGHGVPGAFMSIIGINLLDEIISRGITDSNEILKEMHKGVRKLLKQDVSDNKDGMDMAVCVIDYNEKKLEFSGAKNPLVVIQNNEIQVIKGDRLSIGGYRKKDGRDYSQTTIALDKPTKFYIFSDGYVDQFGGKNRQKFLSRNFYELLHKNASKPMNIQKEVFDKTIADWMGNNQEQLDDILVIGVEIDLQA